jgi:nucleoside permease NupC
MGVPSVDCEKVARLIGLKTIVNEFAAYQRLGELIKNKQIGARAEVKSFSFNFVIKVESLNNISNQPLKKHHLQGFFHF